MCPADRTMTTTALAGRTVSTVQTTPPVINGTYVPASNGARPLYTIVDAETGRPLRFKRYGDLTKAFQSGDEYVRLHPRADYVVLDLELRPVARPR